MARSASLGFLVSIKPEGRFRHKRLDRVIYGGLNSPTLSKGVGNAIARHLL